MFKNFISWLIEGVHSTDQSENNRLTNYEFLVNVHISDLHDVFDADAIWDSEYNRQASESTLNGKPFHQGLREALERTPFIAVGRDERRDIAREEKRYFTDVVIFVDPTKWENQAQIGGGRLHIMADRLAAAHERDFQGYLLNNRTPRYCVMPAREGMLSSPDAVFIQYGLSVFIPDENDQKIADIIFRHDNCIGYQLDEWIFFDDQGHRITRPLGLYSEQKYLQFSSPNSFNSSLTAPNWFPDAQNETLTLFFDHNQQTSAINGRAIARPGREVIAVAQPAISPRGVVTYAFYNRERKRIALEFYPLNYHDEDVITDHHGNLMGRTYVGIHGNVEMETPLPMVYLSHIALPDSTMLMPNFDRWCLAFNQQGQLINTLIDNVKPFITFFLQDGEVYYQSHNMEEAENIAKINSIQIDNLNFRYIPLPRALPSRENNPQPVGEVFHKGLLALPPSWYQSILHFPQNRTIVLGREEENCHQELLNQAGTLFSQQTPAQQTLHDIYFSRQHAELALENQLVNVKQLSATSPILVLDKNMQRINQLIPNDLRTISLESGQAIILGCYTFQVRLPQS